MTGQRWKLHVFWILLAAGFIFLTLFVVSAQDERIPPSLFSATAFTASFLVAFVWLLRSLRCRHCGGRPAWWFVRHSAASGWFTSVIYMHECPICAHRPRHRE